MVLSQVQLGKDLLPSLLMWLWAGCTFFCAVELRTLFLWPVTKVALRSLPHGLLYVAVDVIRAGQRNSNKVHSFSYKSLLKVAFYHFCLILLGRKEASHVVQPTFRVEVTQGWEDEEAGIIRNHVRSCQHLYIFSNTVTRKCSSL